MRIEMGYWADTQKKNEIEDYSTHPWAEILQSSMEQVEPELLQELRETNELEAYLSIKVDDCLKSIACMQNQGMDYETAKELAFDDMMPREPEEPEDWEEEGGLEDAAAALFGWIESRAEANETDNDGADNDEESNDDFA